MQPQQRKSVSHWEGLASLWTQHGKLGVRRTAKEAIAFGAQLLILKSITLHGEFKDRVNERELHVGVANRYMGAARRFGQLPDEFLRAVGSAGKLLELLALDDDDVAALARSEALHGLSLEDLALMTVKELRQAVQTFLARGAAPQGPVPPPTKRRTKVTLSVEEERVLRAFRKCGKEARMALLKTALLLAHH